MSITPYSPPAAEVHQASTISDLREWAAAADAAYAVSERLVQSAFVPVAFRGKPVEACAAILAGAELGLSPMAAVRSFDVIQGVAAPRAITLRAVAQSHGHEMVLVESTATRCIMRGRRRGATDWQSVTWTIDRARELGLTARDGWKKQPAAMLIARATSELARLIAADAILGIGYSAEEIADGSWDGAAPTAAPEASPEPAKRTISRRRTPAPRGGAQAPQEGIADAPEGSAAETGEAITEDQRKAMFAAFRDADGFPDERSDEGRDLRLAYITQAVGREIATSNDLTRREASRVLDALRQDAMGVPEDPEQP